MLDLAIVQLIAGILVALGSTLLAISIGFGLTIPQTMQDALLQSLIMKMDLSPEVQQTILQESLSNYVFILAAANAMLLIITGVIFASAKTAKLRRQIREIRKVADLIAGDVKETPNRSQA
ncbi:MAG: hypothetical protein AB1351_10320 [Thermoproteota archaeon]